MLEPNLFHSITCDALRDLVAFAHFKKHEKHLWRSDTLSKVVQASACNFTKCIHSPQVFLTFFKMYRWYQIMKSITLADGEKI